MKNRHIAAAAFAFTVLLSTSATAQKFPAIDKSIMDVAASLLIIKFRIN
jgi:hypothetical protein